MFSPKKKREKKKRKETKTEKKNTRTIPTTVHSTGDTVLLGHRETNREREGTKRKEKKKVHEEKQFKQVLAIPMALADDYDRLPPTRRGTTAAFDDRSRKRRARVPHTNRHYLFILTSWPIRSHVMELLARPAYTGWASSVAILCRLTSGALVATDRGVSRVPVPRTI